MLEGRAASGYAERVRYPYHTLDVFTDRRPSTLFLEADLHEGRVTAVRVGGASVRVGEGFLELPPTPAGS